MSEIASVEVEQLRGTTVARIVGEVDASNASVIQGRVLDGVRNEHAGVVIDLTGTRYLDSAGIRALFEIGERLAMRGMQLRVVTEPESFIADVLETVRMAERVPVDADAQSAIAALAERLPRERTKD